MARTRLDQSDEDDGIPVRQADSTDHAAIVDVARELPAWFTERGVHHISVDLAFQHALVVDHGDCVIAFLTYYVSEGICWIGWMGVIPEKRRTGLGRALMDALADALRPSGVAEMRVNTLGDSVAYEPYAETRAFYRGVGFTDHGRVFLDDPECPEQLTLSRAVATS